jgi:hypothetical protein
VPETLEYGAPDPVIGKSATKSIVAMPAVSGSSDPRPETDSSSTLLEALIEQLRRLVVESFPSQLLDVLSHAYADVCLPTQTLRYSMSGSTARSHKPHLEATYVAFRARLRFSRRCPSRDNFNRIPVLSP